ncbi:MAG: M23 family metallopeptidase [Clostridiales Family XIII bacterium]|jgi:murein DD-endopeptidase MepM/ murein hydrolase activator NlpD|nr:M23 family metallopeptidase [Clostridiales Family XIII bacterium]
MTTGNFLRNVRTFALTAAGGFQNTLLQTGNKISQAFTAGTESALDRFQAAVERGDPAALRVLHLLRASLRFTYRQRKRLRRHTAGFKQKTGAATAALRRLTAAAGRACRLGILRTCGVCKSGFLCACGICKPGLLRVCGICKSGFLCACGICKSGFLCACGVCKPGLLRTCGICKSGFLRAALAVSGLWHSVCVFAELHKKAFFIASAACIAGAVCTVSAVNYNSAYEYMYNGKVLGMVKDTHVVYSTVELVSARLSEAYGAEIHIDKDSDNSFNRVYLPQAAIDTPEDVLDRLTYMKDMKVKGYAIVADGQRLATLDNEETAQTLLTQVQTQFLDADSGTVSEYIDVDFVETVEIREVDTKLALLDRPEEVLDYILTGAVEEKLHPVEMGDTLSGIAQTYGISLDELFALNPDVVPERMRVGQEIKLERIVPLVTVETKEIATYVEAMPFEIDYENTSAMYQGEQIVKSAGVNGERQVTAEITRQNGLETGKNELSAVTLAEPTTQYMLVGTKEIPPLIGVGYFEYPTRGRLSSRFGTRWGRMHNGIDLAASTGTSIRAADGGKVVFAGWNGALGYTVKIDHGGNRETLYGHCSKLLVSVGESVYQGQHIANVGSTGNSTGPHLHFEVHINGVPKNPLNYL